MKKMTIAALVFAALATFALPAFTQAAPKCPEGQHRDTTQQKCVPH